MLSRVADALYWMGRYLERSENITRLLLVTEDFSSETQGLAEQVAHSAWKDLLAILPSAQVSPPVSAFAPMSQAYLVGFFLDLGNPYSVISSLRRAREEPEFSVQFRMLAPPPPRPLGYGLDELKANLARSGGAGEASTQGRLVGRLHPDLCYRDDPPAAGAADTEFLDRVIDTMIQV